PEVQSELLRELLMLELEYRYQSGEKPQPEEYHHRFPQHQELIDTVFREVTQSAPSSPHLLRRWTMSRMVSQVRMLAFPEERGKVYGPDVLSLLGGILSRAAAEHRRAPGETPLASSVDGRAPGETPLASSELDTATKLLQLGDEADTKVQGEERPARETLPVTVLGD